MVTVKLANIKNPEPAVQTASFIGSIGTDSSSVANASESVQLVANSLGTCSASFGQGLVNRADNLTISFTSLSFLDANAIVKVAFPSSYARDPSNSVVITGIISCHTTLQTYGIFCNSSSSTISVFNAIASNGSYSASFQINNILVPPSTEPIDQLSVSTYNSKLIPYDSCTTTLSNLQAIAINDFSAILSASSLKVDSPAAINFSIPLYNPLFTTDAIVLTFSAIYVPVYQLVAIGGSSASTSLAYKLNYNTTNSINVSTNVNFTVGRVISLYLSQIYGPPSSGIFFTVSLGIYQNGYLKATGALSINTAPNIIIDARTSVASTTLLTLTTYTVTFTTTNAIAPSGMLLLLFPTEIQAGNALSSVKVNSLSVSKSVISGQNGINLTTLPSVAKGATASI